MEVSRNVLVAFMVLSIVEWFLLIDRKKTRRVGRHQAWFGYGALLSTLVEIGISGNA